MNDYYLWMCDLESDEKTIDQYWYDDEWLDYSYQETTEEATEEASTDLDEF